MEAPRRAKRAYGWASGLSLAHWFLTVGAGGAVTGLGWLLAFSPGAYLLAGGVTLVATGGLLKWRERQRASSMPAAAPTPAPTRRSTAKEYPPGTLGWTIQSMSKQMSERALAPMREAILNTPMRRDPPSSPDPDSPETDSVRVQLRREIARGEVLLEYFSAGALAPGGRRISEADVENWLERVVVLLARLPEGQRVVERFLLPPIEPGTADAAAAPVDLYDRMRSVLEYSLDQLRRVIATVADDEWPLRVVPVRRQL